MRRLFDPIKLAALGFALLLLAAWQLLADAYLISPIFFPSPLRAFRVLQQRVADGSLWLPLAATRMIPSSRRLKTAFDIASGTRMTRAMRRKVTGSSSYAAGPEVCAV